MARQQRSSGFSLIELMVVVAIIGILLVLAVPSFGTGVRAARERTVVQKLMQDFAWARGGAAANDASALNSALSGVPTLTLVVNADCSWSTSVNGTNDPNHSMTSTALATLATMSCTGTGMALPATFTFAPQGFVNTTGTLTMTGASSQSFPLQVLHSGAMFRVKNAS